MISFYFQKQDFKEGFFLVFVAKPDNFDCSQENSYIPKINKIVEIHSINITTIINFKIRNSITFKQYFIAIGGTTVVLIAVGLILVILALIFHRYGTISRIVCRGKIINNGVSDLKMKTNSKTRCKSIWNESIFKLLFPQ